MKSLRTELAVGPVLVCLLTAHGAMGRPPLTAARVPSPLTVVTDPPAGAVTTLALDRARYARLRQVQDVIITAFPLDATTRVDLDLYRFEILTEDAQVIVHTATGAIEVPPPDVVLLRGTVAGRPGSRVFLALTPRGTNGYIRIDGDRYVIAGARPGDPRPTVISHLEGLPEGAMGIAPLVCGTDALPRLANEILDGAVAGAASGTCGFEVEIAIETDWEFTDAFEGDIEASGAYAMTLMGAISEIYLTEDVDDNDVGVALTVSHLSLWECNDPGKPCEYPWTANTAHDQLDEFAEYWNLNMSMRDVPRATAHFLSTRPFIDAGGVGYNGVLCDPDLAYALSAHLNGSFPEPLVIEGDPQNWDVFVVAHELGHNFGAPHTHAVAPPIDLCAFGQCIIDPKTMTVEGTIMSYCNLCKGGLVNVNLFFHDRILDEFIHPYLATSLCGLDNIDIVGQPLSQDVCSAGNVTLTVTATANVPLTYQWRKNTIDIPGATNTSFSINPFSAGDVGEYDVIVSGDCSSVLSNVALLGCLCKNISIAGPASQAACAGDSVTFTVVANGNGPLAYQWRKNTADIPGATGFSYSISDVDVTDAGTYDVIVTDACAAALSNGAVLEVDGPACNPNGDVCEGCLTVGEATYVSTTSDNAENLDQTSCGNGDTIAEWLCYTPSCTGSATASLCGSPYSIAFSTTLAVFSSCLEGTELACNAGFCGGIHSQITWDVEAGVTYYLRVSGVDGADGTYIIDVSCDDGTACPADLDGDGSVGINDFLAVLAAWGTDPGGPPDFDGDGDVGINDFLFLLAHWGPC